MAGSDDDGSAPTIAVGAADDDARTRAESLAAAPLVGGSASAMPAAIGRYQLVARLGAGAMGVVWSAVDPQLERKVAIKVVHPRLASAPEASLRMLREARAMAKLSHRAVVTVYDAGEEGGQLFMAMELIDGETLTARLQRPDLARPEAWRQRLALVLEAGRGLAAAHAAGVLHRDFKPDNVLVGRTGRVCVGDFGLAALGEAPRDPLVDSAENDLTLTTTGALLGTPMYMAPQQLRNKPADARADQFAFCVTAYEALYRARPFAITARGLDALPELIAAVEAGVLAPPGEASLVPAAVREVLRRGLAAEPDARWPDVVAVIGALDAASGLRARRRRRAMIAIAGVAAVAVTAAAGAFAYAHSEPPPAASKRSLFRVPLHSRIALGPDARVIAVASDRLEVHDMRGEHEQMWTFALERPDAAYGVEVASDDELRFSTSRTGEARTWRFRTGPAPLLAPRAQKPVAPRVWAASFGAGDLYMDGDPTSQDALRYVVGGQIVRRWPRTWRDAEVFARAPAGEHFAFVAELAAGGVITVVAPDGSLRRSNPIAELTALAWLDEHTLIYARGTQQRPAIFELPLTDRGFGEARELYHEDSGWFLRLAARDGHIVFVDAGSVTHAGVIDDRGGGHTVRDQDPSRIPAVLGWTAAGDMLVWNRSTQHVERVRDGAPNVDTGATLPVEPVNATLAGDTLIVALRRGDGRDIVALDLRTGALRWHIAPHTLHAVRCTDDRAAPCVAVRDEGVPTAGSDGQDDDEVLEIDPQTGALGAVRARARGIADVALRGDGHLVLADASQVLPELDAQGRLVGTHAPRMTAIRSVAFDSAGELLVAGTLLDNTYVAGRVGSDGLAPLMVSESEILLLVRPSPDRTRTAFLGHSFSPELDELVLP